MVPTNTAFFGASNTTSIAFQPFTTTSIGTLQFNPGAPAYSFTTSEPLFTSISITGAGIVNNSSNAPTFIIGNQANIFFRNASTAGDAIIITNAGGLTAFVDSATGGDARFITNAGGAFDITSLSSGGMTAGSIEGAGTFVSGLKPAHRRQQQSLDHGERCYPRHRRLAGQGRYRDADASRHQQLHGEPPPSTAVRCRSPAISRRPAACSVGPGAMLGGTGTVPGVLVNGGTLMPGLPNSVGTLNVAGNLVFTSAATYLININAIRRARPMSRGLRHLPERPFRSSTTRTS